MEGDRSLKDAVSSSNPQPAASSSDPHRSEPQGSDVQSSDVRGSDVQSSDVQSSEPGGDRSVRWRLSGRTAEILVSQAIWRVLPVPDPRVVRRRESLMVWFGLAGPAPTIAEALGVTGFAASTLQYRVRVAAAMLRQEMHPLTDQQLQVLSKPIEPGEDRRARERHAALFGVPKPTVVHVPWGRRKQALAGVAVRCIAALGPLTTAQVTASILESRRRRKENQGDGHQDLGYALHHDSRLVHDLAGDRWSLIEPTVPLFRDSEVVATLRPLGVTFGYGQYRAAMIALGFSPAYRVPFVVHVAGVGRFALADQIGPRRPHRPSHGE